ncbi:glutathione peroxidase [Conidiobolus coronatus NRRL 28638]|uniref:Glutathione peroxidase n=1 Tax=Conidiobolus coronatus (strain ATCC 28846 / CBS 209.66 / NRRL 28638) TaxID=796925 RepID=A0A137P765_CONC2|nr:glutathione peroxidase [Conidiobolus coronatus NRRL 28638]|eukprot:KXN70835.1 glutathione peroxidase [Conidiobolus coronatus NRRL 28638]
MASIYDFSVKDRKNKDHDLSQYENKVILIVNIATKCGFTPQLKSLEKLYKKYKDKDFVILGFPCTQFLNQAPGTDDQVHSFCSLKYDVSFPMMKKVEVNGEEALPLYEYIKAEKPGIFGLKRIKWNFEKFLIDRQGNIAYRFPSIVDPYFIDPFVGSLIKS